MKPHRALFALALALALTAGGRDALDDWVTRTELPALNVPVGTEVVARDGSLLRVFPVADGRWRLDPRDVDPAYLAALIACEDSRFYSHHGVDSWAALRAAGQMLRAGHVVSGASTLTMQVARLIEEGPTGQLSGKLRQVRVAMALERRLTKPEILDLYLRLAPFGGNVEGVRAATLSWFGREPRRLTPAEIALLIALPQSPETRRPDRAPAVARAARDRILSRLAGAGVLDAESAAAATREKIPAKRHDFTALAPYLSERLAAAYPPGARIPTSIDPALQRAAEALAQRAVAGMASQVSVAMIFADHRSGEVLAEVGGAEWTNGARAGFVDLTRAIRSPGSTLKPFVYALAFDDGRVNPETLIDDKPAAFGLWRPQNFDRQFRGTVSVREALILSLNLPAVSLTDAIGPARLIATLRRAGAKVQIPGARVPGLAVALGGLGISLADLVQAYAALARMGQPIALSAEAGAAHPLPGRLFGDVAAWQVADILRQLPPPPGAARDRIAYKTGTSYGNRDALAIGFDGRWVAGVWMGRADGTPVPGAFGGELAAPLLFEMFDRAGGPKEPLPPPPPATLIVPNDRLPPPLQRYRPREAVFSGIAQDDPVLAFPPDGARIELADGAGLTVKLQGGSPPFTWLANGVPLVIAARTREAVLDLPPAGAIRLTVLDAVGRSSSATVVIGP